MKVLLLLVLVAGGAGFYVHREHAHAAEARYAAVASAIAGRPVRIHCQSAVGEVFDVGSEAGSVEFHDGRPEDVAKLKRFVCSALARAPADLKKPDFRCVYGTSTCSKRVADDIQALHTLAHESSHLAGEVGEAAAECRALKSMPFVVSSFGADEKLANATAQWAAAYIYPRLPDDYRGDCATL